jgi:hypothetical protein
MSISLPGTLRIKRINGSNGPFCVGDLETEIGEFRVKDAVLDQFDEGTYAGQFWITQIFPWSYTAYGRMVIEIRARLADLQIEGQRRNGGSKEFEEPDPVKETPSAAPAPALPQAAPEEASGPSEQQAGAQTDFAEHDSATSDDPDLALFGAELYASVQAGQAVKLDPTIDRIQFRGQRDRLKALHYKFDAGSQSWQAGAE